MGFFLEIQLLSLKKSRITSLLVLLLLQIDPLLLLQPKFGLLQLLLLPNPLKSKQLSLRTLLQVGNKPYKRSLSRGL
jgi:hypothetical protein